MKCESCEHYIRGLDTCMFCKYKKKENKGLMRLNGELYKIVALEIVDNRVLAEWERVE